MSSIFILSWSKAIGNYCHRLTMFRNCQHSISRCISVLLLFDTHLFIIVGTTLMSIIVSLEKRFVALDIRIFDSFLLQNLTADRIHKFLVAHASNLLINLLLILLKLASFAPIKLLLLLLKWFNRSIPFLFGAIIYIPYTNSRFKCTFNFFKLSISLSFFLL